MASLATLAANGGLRSLRSLGLSNNAITDTGCLRLAAEIQHGRLPALGDLYLSRNAVGDTCAAALGAAIAAAPGSCGSSDGRCGSSRLERLGLNENRIADEGLGRLLRAIAAGRALKLRELSVNNNSGLCRGEASALLAAMEAFAVSSSTVGDRPLKLLMKSVRCRKDQKDWPLTNAMRSALKISV